ncbi:MAG: UvrD-helicase domain-containing protein [Bacteroidales bacterium]
MSLLTVYKASAGSGKTYKLTEQYLFMVLSNPVRYKNILAVTFTNKATAEMKKRILMELNYLAQGTHSKHKDYIRSTLNLNDSQLTQRASDALNNILHDYSRFSVSTIDHFFQRVIRTFAREMGLQSGYTLETDDSEILNFVIDQLLLATEEDEQLKDWLVDFAAARMQEGKSWDFKGSVLALANELSKEHVKDLSLELSQNVNDKDKLRNYVEFLQKEIALFENSLAAIGKKGIRLIEDNQLAVNDFYQKKRGPANYFYQLASKSKFEPNSYVYKVIEDSDKLAANSTDESTRRQIEGIKGDVTKVLQEAVAFYKKNNSRYRSVREIYGNIYVLGILMDIQKRMDEYCREKNLFLISDASDLLRKIIGNNDAPFVYEKTGSIFRHFLIDEFQDTSRFQWDNFVPLIANSLGENGKNLLVGDIKQSIYRWRNSDWKILSDEVDKEFSSYNPDIQHLDYNYRSAENIIAFNNTIFSYASLTLQQQYNGDIENAGMSNPWKERLNEAYFDVQQSSPFNKKGGYVYNEYMPFQSHQRDEINDAIKQKVIRDIELLQDKGYDLSDIAIVVRKNKEGQELADTILDYKNNSMPTSGYKYDVISNDSLFIANAESVKFILAVFRYFTNPEDNINKAFLVETYQKHFLQKQYNSDELHVLFKNHAEESFCRLLPEYFFKHESELRKMPLYELTEQLIFLFGIDGLKGEVTYLEAFQNMVLDFSRRYAADLNTFLDWWDGKGDKEKLQLPEDYNAIRIITIHKAKGLEFKAVIIPFCNWEVDASASGFKKNYLWPKPNESGLDQLNYVPVSYKKDLAHTIFAGDYYAEKFHNYVDNLNLLYVAFTRAEEVLISYIPLSKTNDGELSYRKKDGVETVGELMHFIMENCDKMDVPKNEEKPFADDLGSFWKREELIFQWGVLQRITEKEDIQEDHLILESYPVFEKTPSLTINYDHDDYFNDSSDLFAEKVDYGKIMHQVFEYINHQEDITEAVDKVYLEGKINGREKAELEEKVRHIIEDERFNHFFSDKWEIYTEREILLPSGKMYRPDRVMMNESETVVLDYKFGEKRQNQHKKKVSQYLTQINKMGYSNPKGYVWYVNQMDLVKVSIEE